MHIFYYHPISLKLNSGETLQIIHDYTHLAKLGYQVHLYGSYTDKAKLVQIKTYANDASVHLTAIPFRNKILRSVLKFKFVLDVLRLRKQQKIIVTRSHRKAINTLKLKIFFGHVKFIHEFHEAAFPHLNDKLDHKHAQKLKKKFAGLLKNLDGILLTNYSQKILLKKEFSIYAETAILPNGVDIEKFEQAKPSNSCPYIITYTGNFNRWKNVELLFHALSLLDEKFILRIAGGNDDVASQYYIEHLAKKYKVEKRVQFFGFVPPDILVKKVIDGSSVLVLPLGENLQSKYLTSPMKLFEYMATKIPVVAINHPSVQLITGNETVFLSSTNPSGFAGTLKSLINSQDNSLRIIKMNKLVQQYSHRQRSLNYDKWIKSLIR